MNFEERKVLVDEADLVLVVVQGGGKERLVHAGAVRALEVVEVDDGDLGVGVAADGAAGDVDVGAGIIGQVKVSRRASFLLSVEMRKFDDLGLAGAGEGDGQIVVAG